jgi:hypothetical protein
LLPEHSRHQVRSKRSYSGGCSGNWLPTPATLLLVWLLRQPLQQVGKHTMCCSRASQLLQKLQAKLSSISSSCNRTGVSQGSPGGFCNCCFISVSKK